MYYLLRKQNESRRNASEFSSLIAEPANGSVTLPAGGRFLITSTAPVALGTQVATVQSGPGTSTLFANSDIGLHKDWIPADSVVTLSAGMQLLVDVGLSVYKLIAEG